MAAGGLLGGVDSYLGGYAIGSSLERGRYSQAGFRSVSTITGLFAGRNIIRRLVNSPVGKGIGASLRRLSANAPIRPDFINAKDAFFHYPKHVKGVVLKDGQSTLKKKGPDMAELLDFDTYLAEARGFFGSGSPTLRTGILSNGDTLGFDHDTGYFGIVTP